MIAGHPKRWLNCKTSNHLTNLKRWFNFMNIFTIFNLKPFIMKNKRHLLFTQRAIELFDFCASTLLLSRRSIRAGYLILPVIFGLAFAQCAKNEFPSPTETMLTSNTDRKALMKDIIAQGGPAHAGGATLRSTTYTFSEAIDLLDETLNYAYCRPGTPSQYHHFIRHAYHGRCYFYYCNGSRNCRSFWRSL